MGIGKLAQLPFVNKVAGNAFVNPPFAPGFRSRIVASAVRTPSDFAAENPNYVGGDIAGGASDLVQLLVSIAGTGRFRFVEWPPEKRVIDIGDGAHEVRERDDRVGVRGREAEVAADPGGVGGSPDRKELRKAAPWPGFRP